MKHNPIDSVYLVIYTAFIKNQLDVRTEFTVVTTIAWLTGTLIAIIVLNTGSHHTWVGQTLLYICKYHMGQLYSFV